MFFLLFLFGLALNQSLAPSVPCLENRRTENISYFTALLIIAPLGGFFFYSLQCSIASFSSVNANANWARVTTSGGCQVMQLPAESLKDSPCCRQ